MSVKLFVVALALGKANVSVCLDDVFRVKPESLSGRSYFSPSNACRVTASRGNASALDVVYGAVWAGVA